MRASMQTGSRAVPLILGAATTRTTDLGDEETGPDAGFRIEGDHGWELFGVSVNEFAFGLTASA